MPSDGAVGVCRVTHRRVKSEIFSSDAPVPRARRARSGASDVLSGDSGFSARRSAFWLIVQKHVSTDFFRYGLWVHGKHPTLLLLVLLWTNLLEDHRQLFLVCPPEHGKSTVMRRHTGRWIAQRTEAVYQQPQREMAPLMFLVMDTAGQAKKQLMPVAVSIEDSRGDEQVFPHLKSGQGKSRDIIIAEAWTQTPLLAQHPVQALYPPCSAPARPAAARDCPRDWQPRPGCSRGATRRAGSTAHVAPRPAPHVWVLCHAKRDAGIHA